MRRADGALSASRPYQPRRLCQGPWLKLLKNDQRAIFTASRLADRAANFSSRPGRCAVMHLQAIVITEQCHALHVSGDSRIASDNVKEVDIRYIYLVNCSQGLALASFQ